MGTHPHKPYAASRRSRTRPAGFTLIEAALTTVIVGTGVLAIVAAQQAYHLKNEWAQRTGTAMLLANEIRELTLTLPVHDPITGANHLGPEPDETSVADYDDVDDFAGPVSGSGYGAGTTFSPPINALRQPLSDLEGWSQVVKVVNVLTDNISVSDDMAQPLGTTDLVRVTVRVMHQGPHQDEPSLVTQLTWLIER